MKTLPYILAFDLGEARIGAAVFDLDHRRIGEMQMIPTMAKQLMVVTLMNLKRVGELARRKAGFEGAPLAVGMGSTGGVDSRSGCLFGFEPLPSLKDFAIGRFIKEEFGAPLYLENNANCFTLGEALVGAGRGHPVVLGLTLGTGFGCGIVINGRIYAGVSGNAGELAYCSTGGEPLDSLLSNSGAGALYTRRTGKAAPTAKQLADLARAGDAHAQQAWLDYGKAIGHVLGLIAAIVDPSICVIGGSIGRRLTWFRRPLEEAFREHLAPPAADRIRLEASQLDHLAGVTGAAKYALQRIEERKKTQSA